MYMHFLWKREKAHASVGKGTPHKEEDSPLISQRYGARRREKGLYMVLTVRAGRANLI